MAHLTGEQRCTISVMLEKKISQSEIAATIGRHKSVVSRETRHNSDKHDGQYRSDLAQKKYEERLRGKPKTIRFTEEVKSLVGSLPEEDYSPEQIAGRCRLEGQQCVSHELIYQYVWADKRHGGTLYRHLRRKGRKYRRRGLSRGQRGLIQGRVGIEKRPAAVDERTRFGDLELDTVIGRNHKGGHTDRQRQGNGAVLAGEAGWEGERAAIGGHDQETAAVQGEVDIGDVFRVLILRKCTFLTYTPEIRIKQPMPITGSE